MGSCLGRDGVHRCPLGVVFILLLQQHPHSPLPELWGYLIGSLIAPSSQGLEPPTKPRRFKVPMSRKEMMNTLGLRGRDNFEKLYLRPALSEGYIEYTLPDKPNSRLQQYRLTEKGRAALASSKPN